MKRLLIGFTAAKQTLMEKFFNKIGPHVQGSIACGTGAGIATNNLPTALFFGLAWGVASFIITEMRKNFWL